MFRTDRPRAAGQPGLYERLAEHYCIYANIQYIYIYIYIYTYNLSRASPTQRNYRNQISQSES